MLLPCKVGTLWGECAKKKTLFFLRDYHSNIRKGHSSRGGAFNYTHGIVGLPFLLHISNVNIEHNFFLSGIINIVRIGIPRC